MSAVAVADAEINRRIGCSNAPHCGDKKKKKKTPLMTSTAIAAAAAASSSSSSSSNGNKQVGLFLPFDDLRALRRGRCAKETKQRSVDADHAHDVASDVSRLMQLAYTNNHQRWTSVQDKANLTADMVRKLLALHLGEAHAAVWTGLGYNGQVLADLEQEENVVIKAFAAPDLVTEAQKLPTQVPAEFWHHLFEHLTFDYTVSQSGGNGNMVTFHKPESEVPMPNRDKRPNMDVFAPFYRKAITYGIAHKDVPFAFFVASALKKKNGLEALKVAVDGQGMDKAHASFASATPSQLDNFFNQVVAQTSYNQERTPAVLSEDSTLKHFTDDWVSLLNYVDTSRLPDVGMTTQAMVTADTPMTLFSTEAGRQERAAQEQSEQNFEAPSADTPGATEGEGEGEGDAETDGEAEGDGGGGEEEGAAAEEEGTATETVQRRIEFNPQRFEALRQLDAHPMMREVRTKWRVQMPSDKLVGMVLARQLTGSRADREQVLRAELGFKKPEQHHAMLEQRLIGLDASALDMKSWHALTHHISNTLDQRVALPDVDDFVKQVFAGSGVAASERPVSRIEQVRRYLAVYGNGSDDTQAWKDVWRAKWPLSPTLEKAIDARVMAVPQVPLETQKALVRAALRQQQEQR